MGLQTPSAPWVLSLAPPLGTLCSVQWLTESIYLCICQALAEPLRTQLLSASTYWHPQYCLGLVTVCEMNPQVGQSLDGLSFSVCSTLCLCISSHGYFVPPSKKDWSIHTLIFLLLELHVVYELYLVFPSFWANIHLSVSAYHVCSIVIGLPHSRHFVILSICLRISWSHCFK